jgi:competence protein ComEA
MEPGSAPWRVLGATSEPTKGPEHGDDNPDPDDRRSGLRAAWIVAGLAVAGVLGIAGVGLSGSAPMGPLGGADGTVVVVASAGAGDVGAGEAATAAVVVVDVAGAVRRPGLVKLPTGSRLADAIAAAGGYSPAVDPMAVVGLNLAATLTDGQQIVVPARGAPDGPGDTPPGSAGSGDGGGGPVDLNRATADELDALPGIGPVTTEKILAARAERPFATLEELVTRKVIGRATLEKLDGLVVVR